MIQHSPLPPSTYGAPILSVPYLTPGPGDPVWRVPDGIVKKALEAKKKHPHVFWLPVSGEDTYFGHGATIHTLFRPMNRREYETLESLMREGVPFNRAVILDECVLAPEGLGKIPNLPAGVAETVYDAIQEVSCWFEVESLARIQDVMRQRVTSNLASTVDMMVTTVFKNLSPLQTQEFDAYTTLELLSMVEQILGTEVTIGGDKGESKQRRELDQVIRRVNFQADNEQLKRFRTAKEMLVGEDD